MTKFALFLTLGFTCANLNAADITAGPKGGRMLEKTSPAAEFYLEKDRTASLTFYNEEGKPIPVEKQSATVIAQPKSGKATIPFEKKGDLLVSTKPLPEGEIYNIVLQLKPDPEKKPNNFRIVLDTSICGGCNRAEYACDCHE